MIQRGDEGWGTGFVIAPNIVMTANHVAINTDRAELSDGRLLDADLLWGSKEYDISLMRVNAKTKILPIDCRLTEEGQNISITGAPNGIKSVVTVYGHVLAPEAQHATGPRMFVDVSIGKGMSGGPIRDESGRVRGVLSMMVVMAQSFMSSPLNGTTGIVIPMNQICPFLGRVE
jgi:S1-C subfamily serine protease